MVRQMIYRGKCKFCGYDHIDHILQNDILVDRCNVCGHVKIHIRDIPKLINAMMYDENIFDAKKLSSPLEFTGRKRRAYYEILASFEINHWSDPHTVEEECNFCGNDLIQYSCPDDSHFKAYYCDYCGSTYFLIDDFKNALHKIAKKSLRHSKWYGFIFYLKEIFLR